MADHTHIIRHVTRDWFETMGEGIELATSIPPPHPQFYSNMQLKIAPVCVNHEAELPTLFTSPTTTWTELETLLARIGYSIWDSTSSLLSKFGWPGANQLGNSLCNSSDHPDFGKFRFYMPYTFQSKPNTSGAGISMISCSLPPISSPLYLYFTLKFWFPCPCWSLLTGRGWGSYHWS